MVSAMKTNDKVSPCEYGHSLAEFAANPIHFDAIA
jgi:hypothetical protein